MFTINTRNPNLAAKLQSLAEEDFQILKIPHICILQFWHRMQNYVLNIDFGTVSDFESNHLIGNFCLNRPS